MSNRRRFRDPSYRLHRASGQAIVTLPDGMGGRRDVLLGKYDTAASRKEYRRVLAEWEANGRQPTAHNEELTVSELIERFWTHAEGYYRRPDGSNTNELDDYKYSLRPLKHLYATLPAREFSPLKLEAVRRLMVTGYDHPKFGPQVPLSRGVINQRVARIVRMFRWAVSKELVSAEVHHALATVTGLQKGRSEARETAPVKPVAPAIVDATVQHLAEDAAAMVRLQQLTGMRPGEVVIMRGCDIDMTGSVWLYTPAHHKLAYRGKARVIALGPRSQAIIRPFLKLNTQAYLFSPAEAVRKRAAALRSKRKTKVQPSQKSRKKRHPQHVPGEAYTRDSYRYAVYRACDRAFPPPAPLAKRADETHDEWKARLTAEEHAEYLKWRTQHRWHVNQLRHSHGTEVRRRFGLEAAQVSLGHAQANVTQVYAERDLGLAVKVAAELG